MRLALLLALTLALAPATVAQVAPADSLRADPAAALPGERSPALVRPSDVPRRLSTLEGAAVLYLGYNAGALGAFAAGFVTASVTDSGPATLLTVLVVYPVATAASMHQLGRLFGADGTFDGTLRGAAIGAGVGAAAGLVLGGLAMQGLDDDEPDDFGDVFEGIGEALAVVTLAILPYTLGTPIGALVGFNGSVQPAVLTTPEGAAPGATLRLRF